MNIRVIKEQLRDKNPDETVEAYFEGEACIYIDDTLTPEQTVSAVIHEASHILFPMFTEGMINYVTEFYSDALRELEED